MTPTSRSTRLLWVGTIVLALIGVRATTVFVVALWLGWGVTAGIAEVWITLTRVREPPPLGQSGAA